MPWYFYHVTSAGVSERSKSGLRQDALYSIVLYSSPVLLVQSLVVAS